MKQNVSLKPLEGKKSANIKRVVAVLSVMCMVALMVSAFPTVFADTVSAATVIEKIIKIVKYICIVVGVLLALMGVVRFILAHNEGDGPAQQKAAITLAVGIILVALGATGILDDIASWIPADPSQL